MALLICVHLWVGVITPVCIFSTVCLLQCRSCSLTVFSGKCTRDFHRDLCVSSYWCVRKIIACFLCYYLQAPFIDKWLQKGLNRSDSTEMLICPHSLSFFLSLSVCHSLCFYLSLLLNMSHTPPSIVRRAVTKFPTKIICQFLKIVIKHN